MSNIPKFAKRIWEKEGPVCDCCSKKIPLEQIDAIHWRYEPSLHTIVCQCIDCHRERRMPKGMDN